MRKFAVMMLAAALASGCSKNNTTSSSSTGGSAGTNAGSGANGSSGATTASNGSASNGGTNGSASNGTGTTGTNSGTSAGTNGTTGTNGATCPTIDGLSLSPASSNVTLSGGTASPITFTATGTHSGANVAVDASLLTWTATRADDTDPGTIANGVYQPNPAAGGTVTLTATGCGQSATASVTFFLDFTTSAVADGGSAIGAGDFGGADGGVNNAMHSPKIVYPSAETRFPRNIFKVLFQWDRQGNDIFRLVFSGANSTVTVYTDGKDPACAAVANTAGCWLADATTWSAIAGSNAGSTVDLSVDGATASGGTVYGSTRETLGFSKRDVPGAIFYWAASVGGIQRATVSDAAPDNYLVPGTVMSNTDTASCAACHALSRDGKFMAVSGSATGTAPMEKGLWNMQVTVYPPPVPLQAEFAAPTGDSYASFSPDDARLIYSARNGGPLLVLDADAGNIVANVVADGGAVVKGIAPDWSPDTAGDFFVYEDLTGNISGLQWLGGTAFGTPRVLSPLIGGKKNGFPRYSPEGDWVAFTNNNTKLYAVPSDGGASIELVAANHVVNNGTDANPKETSMPTWAPPGDLHWVAFNSQRPYGLVTTGGVNQLWVAAIDFSRLDGGEVDPSYPAFFLPFQTPGAKNHRAFWVQDIRATVDAGPPPDAGQPIDAGPPPDAGSCVATGSVCVPLGAGCCEQELNGAYCGDPGDGGNQCIVPMFQ